MGFKKRQFLFLLLFSIFSVVFLAIASHAMTSSISVNFNNIKTRDLLQLLAEYSNKSIVISDKINGQTTINLHDITWRDALDTVLRLQGLVKHETDKVIIIMMADEVNKNEQLVPPPAVFNLRYVAAENVAKLLRPAGALSSYGKIGVVANTNSLVITDTVDKITIIKQLLKQIDIPAKQILIEARIVNADDNFIHELGVDFGGYVVPPVSGRVSGKLLAINANQGKFNLAVAKLTNTAFLDLQLAALEKAGRGKIISKPKLLTTDRQAAYIEAGAEVPYQEKTKEGNTNTVFKKAVLSLKVTPEVVAKDAVSLSLELNQDKIGQVTINGVPTIDTRKIHTQVVVHDGEIVVLGGIYEWSKSTHTSGVPFFSQIPLIEMLFRKKEITMERKELLIFVTPKLIK